MKRYIIIPRFQFNSFYKSGKLFVKGSDIVTNDSSDSKLVEDLVEVFKRLPYFEYDDEYLILNVDIESLPNEDQNLSITQVKEIIALSNNAKTSIESKFDSRIQLNTTKWASEVLVQMENYFGKISIENGIAALWQISEFKENWKDEVFMSESLLNEIIEGVKERNYIKSRDKVQPSIISQAIVYDRTEFFPEGKDGYLFDIFEILCNNLQEGFQFKHTELYSWMLDKHMPGQSNCWGIYNNDKSFEKLNNIRQTLKEKFANTSVRWENAIAWFLSQKNTFQKRGQFDINQFKTELNLNLNDYLQERKLAVIMLGAFLGYKNVYDALYDVLHLDFFKKKETPIVKMMPKTEILKKDVPEQKQSKKESLGKIKPATLKGVKKVNKTKVTTKKKSDGLTLDFGNEQEKSNNITTEKIESPENPEVEFEVTRIIEPEITNMPQALSENRKGEINGIILQELSNLKEFRKWILQCYEEYYFAEDKTKKYFSQLLIRDLKPSGFGKKEVDQVVELFEKKKLIK